MKNLKLLSIANILVFTASFLVSTGSQFKIFDSQDIGEISNKYDTSFAPAGITFSIWGVIYTALFAFCIFHAIKAFSSEAREPANIDLSNIGYLFVINNLASGLWVIAWLHEQLILSGVLMIVQLITLILMNSRAAIYDPSRSLWSKIFTQFPLSIYFAWICVATVANLNAALLHTEGITWPLQDVYWTAILIGFITLIATFIILIRRNVFYGLVIIWAFYGIILKRNSIDPIFYKNIILAAWTGIGVVALVEVIQIIKNWKYGNVR